MKSDFFIRTFPGSRLARELRSGVAEWGGAVPARRGRVVAWSRYANPPGGGNPWMVETVSPGGAREEVGTWVDDYAAARAAARVAAWLR